MAIAAVRDDRSPRYLDYWTRRSPFFPATERWGCRHYAVAGGAYYPMFFSDPVDEYHRLTTAAVLWDVNTERPVEVAGPDAAALMDRLVTRDIGRCPPGACRYALFLYPDGGCQTDTIVLRLASDRFWFSGSFDWVLAVASTSGLDVAVRQTETAVLQVQGPRSREVMTGLFGPPVEDLGYFMLATVSFGRAELLVSRTGWSGELGFEIYLPEAHHHLADELWEAILETGRPFDIAPAGASEIKRVEAGIANPGSDFGAHTTPFEAGLDRAVDLQKTCGYIGRDAAMRRRDSGPRHMLVGLELEGELHEPWLAPWPVRHADRTVGNVTIAVRSPGLQATIANALLAPDATCLGTHLSVVAPWGTVAATVVPRPFRDRWEVARD